MATRPVIPCALHPTAFADRDREPVAATQSKSVPCGARPASKAASSSHARTALSRGRGEKARQQTEPPRRLVWLGGLLGFSLFLFGWDLLSHRFFAQAAAGPRYALLLAWATLAVILSGAVVSRIVRRQQQRFSAVAEQLTRLIESYQTNPADPGRFENPHLLHCRDVLRCECADCPAHDPSVQRCWQVMALNRAAADDVAPRIEIQQCLQCEVYRRSCPDKLTELGESFNNLMFLLEAENKRLGRMRAQMLEKEKMAAIGQVAAGIAHEVCNPLSSISSVVQMLKRKPDAAHMSEDLHLIETHIQRITATVRRLVSLAHPGVQQWELVDVGKTLEDTVQLVAFDQRAARVKIDLQPSATCQKTLALRDQLGQVFINLALNALDAMPDGGRLTIRTEDHDGRIRICFKDTGCGIDPRIGRRVFEPFFTTKPPDRGTGLGLAVSYGIMQAHGGSIDFHSAAGQGTEFVVELPVLRTTSRDG